MPIREKNVEKDSNIGSEILELEMVNAAASVARSRWIEADEVDIIEMGANLAVAGGDTTVDIEVRQIDDNDTPFGTTKGTSKLSLPQFDADTVTKIVDKHSEPVTCYGAAAADASSSGITKGLGLKIVATLAGSAPDVSGRVYVRYRCRRPGDF